MRPEALDEGEMNDEEIAKMFTGIEDVNEVNDRIEWLQVERLGTADGRTVTEETNFLAIEKAVPGFRAAGNRLINRIWGKEKNRKFIILIQKNSVDKETEEKILAINTLSLKALPDIWVTGKTSYALKFTVWKKDGEKYHINDGKKGKEYLEAIFKAGEIECSKVRKSSNLQRE